MQKCVLITDNGENEYLHVNNDNSHCASSDEEFEGLSGMLVLFEAVESIGELWVLHPSFIIQVYTGTTNYHYLCDE